MMALLTAASATMFAPTASADVGVLDTCPTGLFCAYDNPDFTGLLLQSADTGSDKIDVADDLTSAGDNQMAACWRGRNRRALRPDETTHTWPAFTRAVIQSDKDNKTDHFDHHC
jgi:hypothetical protein